MTFQNFKAKNMTIKEKILAYLTQKKVKKAPFFDKVGIASSNFKGEALQSELGGDKIAKILAECPDLSAEWLLRGIGNMCKDPIDDSINELPCTTNDLTSIIQSLHAESLIQAEEIGRLKERLSCYEQNKK